MYKKWFVKFHTGDFLLVRIDQVKVIAIKTLFENIQYETASPIKVYISAFFFF